MKIDNFKINSFGKLKNKEIKLDSGINIISGKNEAGKSTVLKFISSMLYGVSKNKNGKEISDFDKFKPWDTDEFSGKLTYTLDNGKNYEIYREFKKKNPIIYDSNKEDISKSFNIDKTKGIEFFKDQTGVDEETFYSTSITEQNNVKLNQVSQNNIIQKISNLISSGDDNISFKKVSEKLNKRQNEEVGTERTSQRPINIVDNKINELLNEKKDLEIYRESILDNSSEKDKLNEEIKDEIIKKDFLKEVKSNLDNNRLKNAEINLNKNLEKEYNQKIEELNKQILSKKLEKMESKKIDLKKYYIGILISIVIFLLLFIVNHSKLFFINFVMFIPIILIILKLNKIKKEQIKIEADELNDVSKIKSEIEILKQNSKNQSKEVNDKERKLLQEIERENKELIEKYREKINLGYMQENFVKNYDEILRQIEEKDSRINTIKFRLQTIENRSKEITKKLEDLAKIEEQLQNAENEKEELITLNNSYNIAKECLENAYKLVKENVSPKFTQNLSDIIKNISNDKYSNIILNDKEGLKVEIYNGSYIPVSRLSIGTIDQMYVSLRLSALDEISSEKMPIILDESFAYFDNERLNNMLVYLNENYKNNQIIIFTCSDREEEILKNLDINYSISRI